MKGAAIAAWFILMLGVGAGLLAKHVAAFRMPEPTERLGAVLGTLRGPADQGRWFALHVLYSGCACSQRVVDHLTSTKRSDDWKETVLWVGSDPPDPALLQHGFGVRQLTIAEFSRYGIEAAPALVALDPQDGVRYLGGYTERKQGPEIEDLHILAEARAAQALLSPLPVFGCAVGDRVRRALAVLPGL